MKPGGTNGSGFISNVSGGTVMTEPAATAFNRFVGSVTFPGQEGAAGGGFLYSMHKDTDTCGLLPCNFAMFIDVIPAAYDNPQTEGVRVVLKCDATVCPGTSTAIQMFVRDETGQQKLVLGCMIAGIVDPAPVRRGGPPPDRPGANLGTSRSRCSSSRETRRSPGFQFG